MFRKLSTSRKHNNKDNTFGRMPAPNNQIFVVYDSTNNENPLERNRPTCKIFLKAIVYDSLSFDTSEKALNSFGKEGWEIFSVVLWSDKLVFT